MKMKSFKPIFYKDKDSVENAKPDPSAQKKKKKRHKIRIAAAIVIFFIVALTDIYFEAIGLPEILNKMIIKELAVRNIFLKAQNIKAGIINGIVFSNATIRDGRAEWSPTLKADRISARLSLAALISGYLPLDRARVVNGSAKIFLFPECGLEGLGDYIEFNDFNAELRRESQNLKIVKARGNLQNIKLDFSGNIRNIFLPDFKYDKKKKDKSSRESSRLERLIKKIPLSNRKKISMALKKLEEKNFKTPPEIKIKLNADMKNFKKSNLEAKFKASDFSYGKLQIQSVIGDAVIKNESITLNSMQITLSNNEYCRINGSFNMISKTASGTVTGKTETEKLLLFFDDKSSELIKENFKLDKEFVTYNGSLSNYSITTGKYSGKISVNLPSLNFKGLKLHKLSVNLFIKENGIKGALKSAKLARGGNISGSFDLAENKFSAKFKGHGRLLNLEPMLAPKTKKFIDKNINIKTASPINFSGTAHKMSDKDLEGKIKISTPFLEVRKLKFKDIATEIAFSPKTVKAENIKANLDGNADISGGISFIIPENIFLANILCRGAPREILNLLEKGQRKALNTFLKDIKWPKKNSLTESNLDLYYQWKENPFYFLSGNIVMTDFEYKSIKFNYGASKFYIDSDNLVIMPGIALESPNGQALIGFAYDGRDKSAWSQKSPYLTNFKTPKGQLIFALESALIGNNLLKCLYAPWQSEYLDFNQSIKVIADGIIDFKDEDKTVFSAVLQNGKCEWNKLPIVNIDAKLYYQNRFLEMKNATGEICGGNLNIDYDFNFKDKTGNIGLDLRSANLTRLLKHVRWESVISKSEKEGLLSGKVKAKIAYDKNDELLMYGKGNLKITKGDLWSIPFFGGLLDIIGKAWSVKAMGNVSEVNCDYILKDDKFISESIQSDGNILSLNGNGEYSWHTNKYEFDVSIEPLKHALPFKAIPYFLKPFTWLLEAKVSGKGRNMKWE
jgi:hypothetical protein